MQGIENQKAICPICGEEFIYLDIKNKPKTCGKRECKVNSIYRRKHYNDKTGEMPDPEDIRRW